MRVFLSWSGAISKAVAVTLRNYLPRILQSLDVFMSKHDIESGARWANELSDELEKSSYGILCLTNQNLESSWLLFEAGSLAKHGDARAVGLLIGGLSPTDVAGPLAQFQHRSFNEEELLPVLRELNARIEKPLESKDLESLFEKFWPDIQKEYEAALTADTVTSQSKSRDERELLEEVLKRVRGIEVSLIHPHGTQDPSADDVLQRPVTVDSLAWYTLRKFPDRPVAEKLQAMLLRDLDESKYLTIAQIDQAVRRAEKAVAAYERESPDLFGFGTDRITKSLGFTDPESRARHGFGVQTRNAFKKYEDLVEPES